MSTRFTSTSWTCLLKGGQGSLFLNFALFLIGVAMTVTATLLSTTISQERVYTTFVLLTLVTWIAGVVLLALWGKTYRSSTNLITVIKNRMPAAPAIEQLAVVVEPPSAPLLPSVTAGTPPIEPGTGEQRDDSNRRIDCFRFHRAIRNRHD